MFIFSPKTGAGFDLSSRVLGVGAALYTGVGAVFGAGVGDALGAGEGGAFAAFFAFSWQDCKTAPCVTCIVRMFHVYGYVSESCATFM